MTREVWSEPLHTADFDWRVSVAEVEKPGAFSLFPQHDRIIMPLSAHGMELGSEGTLLQALKPLVPFHFRGDLGVSASLPLGTVTDFNFIYRRELGQGSLQVFAIAPLQSFEPPQGTLLVFAIDGGFTIQTETFGWRDSVVDWRGEALAITGTGRLACCGLLPRSA